jgi:hypothetical protein
VNLRRKDNMPPKGSGDCIIDLVKHKLLLRKLMPAEHLHYVQSVITVYEETKSKDVEKVDEFDIDKLDMLSRRFRVWEDS